jgi:hypothetical protein
VIPGKRRVRAAGTAVALRTPQTNRPKESTVDLTVWIPLTVALGLGALGLMVLFVEACDRV